MWDLSSPARDQTARVGSPLASPEPPGKPLSWFSWTFPAGVMSLSPMCLLTVYVSILENYLSMYLTHCKTVTVRL